MAKMTFAEAKLRQGLLEAEAARISDALKQFPRLPNGLTPDAIKFSPEYRTLAASYAVAFNALRKFNAAYVKAFKTELRAERRAR